MKREEGGTGGGKEGESGLSEGQMQDCQACRKIGG